MSTLNRLLIADLKRMWAQALAICAVLACGVATFVMSMSTMLSLEESNHRYYRDYRFADVFVSLKRAPSQLADRFRRVPGVERVDTRVVRDVILDMPGMNEPASCRLISLPDRPGNQLNGVYLRRGRMPDRNRRGEVLASEMFAEAHGLVPGDTLKVIMGGREQTLRIVGVGLSPEYVFAVQPGMLVPDNRRFGVLWMPYRQMAAAFNMEGAFNDASFTLKPNASVERVIEQTDRLVEQYGGLGAYTRRDQPSHRRIADEIHQLRGMSMVTPTIFLSVAAFLFNLVLSRKVRQQQEQIATLRAFGYGPLAIGGHYLKLLLILVACGVIVGSAGGVYLSFLMNDMYSLYFRFPTLHDRVAWDQIGVAALLSMLAAGLGGLASIRRAMRLPPAVAMRPESPGAYQKSIVERIGLGWMFTPVTSMIFRRLERNGWSTTLSILGMSLGAAIVVLGTSMEDAIKHVIRFQFDKSQRQDVTVTFAETLSARSIHDAKNLPGVTWAEPYRAITARLSFGRRTRKVSIMGLVQQPRLFRVLDKREQAVEIMPGGLTVSRKLAELLGARVGDTLQIEVLEGEKIHTSAIIVQAFPDYTDPQAYMNRRDLHRLLREGECLSGAFLAVDPRRIEALHRQVKDTPTIAGVTLKDAALRNFKEIIDENLGPMRTINALFASVIAFGVIYNCALITLAERSRDLATMRVLGFTRREVAMVLIGELGIITLAALPIGLPIGYALSYLAMIALDTETNRFPVVVTRATYAYAATLILAAAAVSAYVVRGMIDRLDLLGVLKVKE